jgi:cation transport protein ChaC
VRLEPVVPGYAAGVREAAAVDGDLWIFGYGSLIWRPAFSHLERRPGFIRGWARRFWQGSTDHRGVPSAPGRVVTLIRAPRDRCWGVAYCVAARERDGVLEMLDHRERGGFDRIQVEVEFRDPGDRAVPALVYLATDRNPNYLGPATDSEIVDQIRRARGPSGPNTEYALRLAQALRDIDTTDDHVFAIADRLRVR